MVVLEVDVGSIAIVKSERYPPVARDLDGPHSLTVALELMEIPARDVDLTDRGCGIDHVELNSNPSDKLSGDSTDIASREEALEALVPKAQYHLTQSGLVLGLS